MVQVLLTPTQDNIFSALRGFLSAILPPMPLRQGQQNRVSEPKEKDFCVFWLINSPRIATNIDDCIDGVFTGTIADDLMTIATVNPNFTEPLRVGSTIFGVNVEDGTVITELGSGTGGVGTYTVSPGGQTVGIQTLAAGIENLTQAFDYTVQIDVHGPNAINNANTITTLFRDERGVELFQGSGFPVEPLYADDPLQIPFQNAEQQWETRQVITAHMQVNFTVTLPQQFADQVVVDLINVDTLPI